jgi:putative ATP-dependent endonuclease of the OLD family
MRLARLGITNFRSISAADKAHGVDLEIDDNNLIFLCGKNNSGKSTILAAYEMFVIANRDAELQDFFNKEPANHIVIEATIRAENEDDVKHQALAKLWDENKTARIRKTWKAVGQKGEKESYDPKAGEWKEGGAGGFDTLLQNACPTPVWVRGTTTPDEVLALLRTLVQETILRSLSTEKVYADAIAAIKSLDDAITGHAYAASLQKNLNKAVAPIFPSITFALKNDEAKDVTELFKTTATIEVQEHKHPGLGLSGHGHGLRRQFVMSAFRGLALQLEEVKKTAKQRKPENLEIAETAFVDGTPKSRMLLVEEPELFLHPAAVRGVRELLYLLGSSSEFQVMAATHSPLLIDLSRPHTTLIRVESHGAEGTRAYQVSNTLFSDDDRSTMKMLNYFDPYVCEAFFASRVILVEGDTEAVAIRQLIYRLVEAKAYEVTDDLHVVNCGTKMNIPFFQKVLTHFRIPYHVFHDLDSLSAHDGSKSPAWTMNEKIWAQMQATDKAGVSCMRYVFQTEFESANGYKLDNSVGKPYSAYREAATWDLNDKSKAAILFLRSVLDGIPPAAAYTQELLEQMASQTPQPIAVIDTAVVAPATSAAASGLSASAGEAQ